MSDLIYQLRYQELRPDLAARIWPFVNAYRPHDPVQGWRELRESGLDPIEEESLMDVIVDQHEAEKEAETALTR